MTETALATRSASSLARRDELTIEDMVAQVQKIQQVMDKVMKKDEHYGVIPGTGTKPSLLKAGAEKLCLLFRLAPTYTIRETVDGRHLTIESTCTLTHIPTSEVWGSGMGSCSTKESKYAYRKGKRLCPKCGADAINKSKYPPRGKPNAEPGYYCYAKVGGCGQEFAADDQSITGQDVGRVANEDVADQYNTVLKMSNKRALVAAVLNVTAASDIFTQDLEDMPLAERPVVIEATATEVKKAADVPPEVLFQTPAEEDERARLVDDMNRLMVALKLPNAERLTFFETYLGARTAAAIKTATLEQLTELVNALRARAGESKWGSAA